MRSAFMFALMLALLAGCGKEPGSKNLTKGSLIVECDEAIFPVVQREAEEFQRLYPDSKVTIRSTEARAAVSDFASDSVQVIIIARSFNKEESTALTTAKVEYQEYKTALAAVAVIAHPESPVQELRMTELDSLLEGNAVRWSGKQSSQVVEVVIGGINSSTNEVVKDIVLKGKPFVQTATSFPSSDKVVEWVRTTPNTLGLVGVNWLKDREKSVTVMALRQPGFSPDSLEPAGQPYTPMAYYVYKGFYPLSTPVMIYTRVQAIDISRGFIAFVNSGPGQKIIQSDGLVPATQPVRIVQLSSEQVR